MPARSQALNGVKMELEDCGFDLLMGVICTSDPTVAFQNIDVLIGLGAFPRGPGMAMHNLGAVECNLCAVDLQINGASPKSTAQARLPKRILPGAQRVRSASPNADGALAPGLRLNLKRPITFGAMALPVWYVCVYI